MDSWHHDMHYKVKVKTGEYKFGDNDDKLGEVELVIKVPMMEKDNAENMAKPWTLHPEPQTKTLDFFKKEVV
jgi:hypothetical protein